MYENAAFCNLDVNLIKIDYSGDPKSCLIENIFLRNILWWHFLFFNVINGMM